MTKAQGYMAINANNGRVMVKGCTESQFDRWYDQCAQDYRRVRDISEVNPEFRDAYAKADTKTYYLTDL